MSRNELAYLALKAFISPNILTVYKKREKLTIQFKFPNKVVSLTNSGNSITPKVTDRIIGKDEDNFIKEKFWNETFAEDRKGTISKLEKILNATVDKAESERFIGISKFFTKRVIAETAEKLLAQAQLANSFYAN